jgi:hypothetical protein
VGRERSARLPRRYSVGVNADGRVPRTVLLPLASPGLQVRLDSPLALPLGRTPPVPLEEHFEQIANSSLLCLLREGMTQR